MTDRDALVLSPDHLRVGIAEMKARYGPPPWAATLVSNDRFVVTVICQAPGHANDWHYHLSDESWFVAEGELSWTLEGRDEPIRVKAGEWVLAPADTFHLIEVHGEQPAIRIATTYTGEYHRHERDGAPPPPPGTS